MTTVIAIIASLAAIVLLVLFLKTRENIAHLEKDSISRLAAQREEAALKEAALQQEASRREAELRAQATERETALTGEHSRLNAEVSSLRTAADSLREQLAAKDKQMDEARQHNATLLKQQEERFKNLANEIMEANSRRFNEASSQRLNDLLSPLKENIENFRKAVGDAYNNESRERFSLQKELRELLELNKTIGREARDLTRALRSDSKMQGDWGEMILEKLLEKSGLQKGMHFDTQVTRDTDGSRLADDRCLVIDSKVSLTSFIDYINLADDPDDDGGERRKQAAAHHLASVKSHINELSRKSYQDLIGKKRMDFVMMFIPNEAAYIAAMQIEPGLWQEAYDKRVLMVSPTQLISVLRMLRQLWKQDAVNRNVEEIARLSGRLLDKFSGMMEAFDDVEKHIANTQKACTTLRSRLSDGPGNVFVTARKILDLGAKSTKQLPEK